VDSSLPTPAVTGLTALGIPGLRWRAAEGVKKVCEVVVRMGFCLSYAATLS